MADTSDQALLQQIGIRAFREHLSGYLRQAREGESFLVTSNGEVLAEIRPPPASVRPRRRPGALRGQIIMAPDFDTLPPDVLAAMESLAGEKYQSRAALIRAAIDDYLDRHRREQVADGFGLWGAKGVDGLAYQDEVRDEW
jgi:antitoxin (DNA-binding transcriptional repressor) of toxin-antitoxin stability system